MSIRLTGQLLSPTDGSPAANAQIRFISLDGTGSVPKGAISIEVVNASGNYDFTLEFGRYSVEIRQADKFVKQGAVSVNADTPTPLEIGGLLEYTEPLTPSQIAYVEELTEQAEASAQAANVSQSAANSSAMAASNSAAEAKSEADRASEITGLDTVEEAIDLTLAKTLGLMTETEAMAQADAYEQVFAASGMVHMGKAKKSGTSINEGVYPEPSIPNTLGMGRLRDNDASGTSKTDFAVTYIAGAISNLLGASSYPNDNGLYFELPPAEAGTRIYDSTGDARGSGKATLDFRYDVDPKYGDVPTGSDAEILREAVGRAFGEHRWDVDEMEATDATTLDFTTREVTIRRGGQGVTLLKVPTDRDKIVLNIKALSHTGEIFEFRDSRRSGTGPLLASTVLVVGENEIDLKQTGLTRNYSFVYLRRPAGSYPVTITFDSIYVGKSTEEVVTHPVDLLTWESYDEELTGRTEVFECIQSLSTKFGDTDVPTVLSTRPNSYFDQYDGQSDDPDAQNTKYRCVVWDDLTDEQKRKVAAYMGNKLYVGENGYLVNRRLRARTERSIGNGNWLNISSLSGTLQYDANSKVKPRGNQDVATTGQYDHDPMNKGVFKSSNASVAYQGRCYLYVIGQRA